MYAARFVWLTTPLVGWTHVISERSGLDCFYRIGLHLYRNYTAGLYVKVLCVFFVFFLDTRVCTEIFSQRQEANLLLLQMKRYFSTLVFGYIKN